jgi:hypothetical protein
MTIVGEGGSGNSSGVSEKKNSEILMEYFRLLLIFLN